MASDPNPLACSQSVAQLIGSSGNIQQFFGQIQKRPHTAQNLSLLDQIRQIQSYIRENHHENDHRDSAKNKGNPRHINFGHLGIRWCNTLHYKKQQTKRWCRKTDF